MESRRKINVFHILVCGLAFYLLVTGFAFFLCLLNPHGVILTFAYWQKTHVPSQQEYQQMRDANSLSGIGAFVALIAAFIVSIFMDRRIRYHWVNSLVAAGVCIAVAFGFKEIGLSPYQQMFRITRLFNLSAIPANALFGLFCTGAGVLIFLINKGRILDLKKPKPEELTFQFEEQAATRFDG